MTVHRKTLIIISSVLALLTACALAVTSTFMLILANKRDYKVSVENTLRALNGLGNTIAALDQSTGDYAGWDDTYAFVTNRSKDYITANLADETFAKNKFGFMVFVDSKGRVVHSKGFDLVSGAATAVPKGLLDLLTPGSSLLSHGDVQTNLSGVAAIPEGPILLAAKPILTSRYTGPARGTLLIGRPIDSRELDSLKQLSLLDVSIQPVNDSSVPAPVRDRLLAEKDTEPIIVEKLSMSRNAGFALIRDVFGQPALALRVSGSRYDFLRAGRDLIFILFVLLAVGGGAVGVSIILLNRLVLARTSELNKFAVSISTSGNLSKRFTLTGEDELTELGRAFNRLLDTIEKGITERQLAEESMKKQESFLRDVIDAHPGFVFVKDREGRFILANKSVAQTYGTTTEAIVGKSDVSFNPNADEVEHFHKDDMEVIDSKQPKYIAEEKITDARGRVHWLSTYKLPLLQKDGSCSSLLGVSIDVSERKQAQEERQTIEMKMQQSQKLESLGVLAGGIAHDFNNLLMAVLGNADMVLSSLPADSPYCEPIQDIVKGSRRAADLCKQMLAYSGKSQFVIEPLDLSVIVREMTHMLEVAVSKKAILRYKFADNLPAIEADATQLRQVSMNLILNASEALGNKSGVIAVSTGVRVCDQAYLRGTFLGENLPAGTYVYIEVTDTGCGIDKKDLPRIFEPFFTTKFTGRGLGLTAVFGIVRGHRGTFHVESRLGHGTTFRALFPASDRGAVRKDVEPEPTDWRGNGTVLVVDDEETVLVLTKRMIERSGFTVLTAVDGRDALEVFKQNLDKIVCVVSDLTMPRMDGEEEFREMKKIRPDIRLILASGYDAQEVSRRFEGCGIAGFIEKPYTRSALLTVMKQVMESIRKKSEAREFSAGIMVGRTLVSTYVKDPVRSAEIAELARYAQLVAGKIRLPLTEVPKLILSAWLSALNDRRDLIDPLIKEFELQAFFAPPGQAPDVEESNISQLILSLIGAYQKLKKTNPGVEKNVEAVRNKLRVSWASNAGRQTILTQFILILKNDAFLQNLESTESRQQESGMTGSLHDIVLSDLIQIFCAGIKSTKVEIDHTGEKGAIYIQNGEIIETEAGDLRGESAFYKVMSWKEGSFITRLPESFPPRAIQAPTMALLMESARRGDEGIAPEGSPSANS